MTGPEHYLEAERLLAIEATIPANNDETNPAAMQTIAEAHIHATLALAAATALTIGHEDDVAETLSAWHKVAGEVQR